MNGSEEYLDRDSALHQMDAFGKLLCLLLLITAIILTRRLAGFVLLTVALLGGQYIAKVTTRAVWGSIWRLRFFFLAVFLMNFAFFDAEDAFFSWWIFSFSWEGMTFGAVASVRIILAVAAGNLFVAVTTPVAITGAVETLLWPLQWLGIPVRDVALILGAALQFVPLLQRESESIKIAQTARGAPFQSKKLWERFSCFPPLVLPIFLAAFQRADDLACAMESRGYVRKKGRLPWRKRRFHRPDVLCLSASALLFTAAIVWF